LVSSSHSLAWRKNSHLIAIFPTFNDKDMDLPVVWK
jgi:hypothetical protein